MEVLYKLRNERPDVFTKTEVYIDGGVRRGTGILADGWKPLPLMISFQTSLKLFVSVPGWLALAVPSSSHRA